MDKNKEVLVGRPQRCSPTEAFQAGFNAGVSALHGNLVERGIFGPGSLIGNGNASAISNSVIEANRRNEPYSDPVTAEEIANLLATTFTPEVDG